MSTGLMIVCLVVSIVLVVLAITKFKVNPAVALILGGLVAAGFLTSWAASRLPLLAGISSGLKTIVLTVILSLGAAILFPVKEESSHDR